MSIAPRSLKASPLLIATMSGSIWLADVTSERCSDCSLSGCRLEFPRSLSYLSSGSFSSLPLSLGQSCWGAWWQVGNREAFIGLTLISFCSKGVFFVDGLLGGFWCWIFFIEGLGKVRSVILELLFVSLLSEALLVGLYHGFGPRTLKTRLHPSIDSAVIQDLDLKLDSLVFN